MYYPLKKQFSRVSKIYTIEGFKNKAQEFLKQLFMIFFKLFLVLVLLVFSYFIFASIQMAHYVKNYYDNNLIISSMDDVINQFNSIINKVQNYDSNLIFADVPSSKEWDGLADLLLGVISEIIGKIIAWLMNLLVSIIAPILEAMLEALSDGFTDALELLNAPIEPITSDVIANYEEAQRIFYELAYNLDIVSGICDAIPFIDFGIAFAELSEQVFQLGNMVGEKFDTIILPMIELSEHMWINIVTPFSAILDLSMWLITTLTGLTLFVPLLTQNSETLFNLPIYFWLSYSLSLVFAIAILAHQLVSASGTINQNKKQKIGKNLLGGIFMTIFSIIFIPILFLSLIFIGGIIISAIFDVSGIFQLSDSNIVSNFFVSTSFINGASLTPSGLLGDFAVPDYPYAYLHGQTIIVTSTYFDYTSFVIFSTITIIFLFVIIFWLAIKIFNVIQLMIIGPITTSFFIKDGGLSFRTWLSEVTSLFVQLAVMAIQISILISVIEVFNVSMNQSLVFEPKLATLLVTFLIAAMAISMFVIFTKLRNILFKDRTVKASVSSEDFEGAKFDTNVTNKSLEVNSKNISATLKKVSNKEQKYLNKNLNLQKQSTKINDELYREIKSMKIAQEANTNLYKELSNKTDGRK